MGKKGKRRGPSGECDCTEMRELVVHYIDEEVSAEMRQRVLVHIQDCEVCARLLYSLKRTVHYCQIEPGFDVPVGAHQRLWQRLRQLLPPGE